MAMSEKRPMYYLEPKKKPDYSGYYPNGNNASTNGGSYEPIYKVLSKPVTPSFASARSDDELRNIAAAQANALYGVQRQATLDEMAQAKQNAQTQRDSLMRNQAYANENNRYQFAGTNLANSGFMAGANAMTAAETQKDIGTVNSQEAALVKALQNRLSQLAADRANQENTIYNNLVNSERQYGLSAADTASNIQGRNFNLERGQALLPYEIGSARLGNDQAAFALSRGRTLLPYEVKSADTANQTAAQALSRSKALLPYEIGSADIANRTADAQYTDQYTPGGLGYQSRQAQVKGQQLQNQAAELQAKVNQLEYEIMMDPNLGTRTQKQAELDKAKADLEYVKAQTSAANALATQRVSGDSGLTPYQQYQVGQDQQAQIDKVSGDKIKGYTDNYAIGRDAAQVWVDYQNLLNEGNPYTGKPFTPQEKAAVINQMTRGLNQNDVEWVNAMWHAANGETWYNQYLTNFLKSTIGDKSPQLYGQLDYNQ